MRRIRVAVALVVLAALVGFHCVGDWDSFWQLLVGRVAVSARSFLPVDEFSYSRAGQPFHPKDLVGYVLLHLTHALGGFFALAVLRTLVALAIAALLLRPKRSALAGVVVAAWLLAAIQFRLIPRALLFSELGFVALVVLLEEVRGLDDSTWRLWLAPPLLWIWINLHRGALLGYAVLAGFLGYRWLTRRTLPPRFWLTLPAALVLGLLNPSGLDSFTSAVNVTFHPVYRDYVSEWHALTPAIAFHYFPATAALVIAGWLALAVRFRRHRDVDLWHLGLFFVTTVAGIRSLRFLSFAASMAALILLGASSRLRALERPPRGALLLAVVAGGALIYLTNAHSLGFGPEPGRFPEGAIAYARAARLGPRVHNSFVYGGYLAWAGWPDFRVLVDGRNDQLYTPDFYLRCVRAQHDAAEFSALEAELPSDWVLADDTAGSESFAFLARDPAWMLVYWSDPATVWVRRAARPDLAADELHLDPARPVPSLLAAMKNAPPDALERELQRMLTASPESVRANVLLALFYDGRGRTRERDLILERLDALAPDHPAVKQLHAQRLR